MEVEGEKSMEVDELIICIVECIDSEGADSVTDREGSGVCSVIDITTEEDAIDSVLVFWNTTQAKVITIKQNQLAK